MNYGILYDFLYTRNSWNANGTIRAYWTILHYRIKAFVFEYLRDFHPSGNRQSALSDAFHQFWRKPIIGLSCIDTWASEYSCHMFYLRANMKSDAHTKPSE